MPNGRDRAIVLAVVAFVAAFAWVRAGRESATSTQGSSRAPRMVDLGAGRCIPCKKMAPILAELRSEYAGRAEVVFIDVWEQTDLADQYSFRAIPTQIFYDREGREVWRHEGFLDKPDIVAQFRRMGVE